MQMESLLRNKGPLRKATRARSAGAHLTMYPEPGQQVQTPSHPQPGQQVQTPSQCIQSQVSRCKPPYNVSRARSVGANPLTMYPEPGQQVQTPSQCILLAFINAIDHIFPQLFTDKQ